MAGTDGTRTPRLGGPSIVLVGAQLGENIGQAARAMLNGGLTDLRLVAPREPWPNPRAHAAASGAGAVIEGARVFATVEAAVADLRWLWATSARPRDMVKPLVTPRQATAEMRRLSPTGDGCGVLFGPERTGLENPDVVRARAVITVPANPGASSLNLAHAVLLLSYEWYQGGLEEPPPARLDRGARPASQHELAGLFAHLEEQLDAAGFLYPPEKRPLMVQSLRNILSRADLTEQEVRTLHGVLTALAGRRWRRDS
ncbi:MAG TPA: RNA methyltransferase [Thermoanaerobaculia bacterium]|nr:RNA methyltransferase [Thermoanaerobaculia bacterium]